MLLLTPGPGAVGTTTTTTIVLVSWSVIEFRA